VSAPAWLFTHAPVLDPDTAIRRGLEHSIRSIEHGNFLDDATAPLFAEHDAFLVPTLVTYDALARDGAAAGMPPASVAKILEVRDDGFRGLETAHRHGVPIALGTDLLGSLQSQQLHELTLRREVQRPADILRSATTVGAALLQREGQLGTVSPGAGADLLVVDGNPLEDLSVLTREGPVAVWRAGELVSGSVG
jgi:imidazolonepropionase-like amidohydrolase